jgi:hypothetical protein
MSQTPRTLVGALAIRLAATAAALGLAATPEARAQGALFQGVIDAEWWATSGQSTLLTRNANRGGVSGRLSLWSAVEPRRGFVVYAQGQLLGGPVSDKGESEWYLDQLGVRVSRSDALVLDAGKLSQGIGTFAARRLSPRNPLIGTPDGYPITYPYGLQLSGTRGIVDYRAAVMSLPVTHEEYVPEATAAPHPLFGVGITPTTGLHVGVATMWGPYLNDELASSLLAGRSWKSYEQRVGALDVAFSRGYLETHAEAAVARYEVPTQPGITGYTYYGEGRYTITPRLFAALRYERNNYPFIRAFGTSTWVSRLTDFQNGEVGLGWRFTPSLLMKASYRADRWVITPENAAFVGNGKAVAVQASYGFDVLETVRRR